jgi:S-adenosylmethionine decarboxylase proenzyme
MKKAALSSGATIINSVFHTFNPHGVSGVVVIAESHLAIHTWPEYGYAAIDVFTCGDVVDPAAAITVLETSLAAGSVKTQQLQRGILNTDKKLLHKPENLHFT